MRGLRFTHVDNLTGHMQVVAEHFAARPQGLKILDLPAGNGLLADALRAAGHTVVCGGINRERDDYRDGTWRCRCLSRTANSMPVLFGGSLVLVQEKP